MIIFDISTLLKKDVSKIRRGLEDLGIILPDDENRISWIG